MGWIRRNKSVGRPQPPTTGTGPKPPTTPLFLDGAASWKAYTGPEHAHTLSRIPAGTELVVDAVAQSQPQAVSLHHEGVCVGQMYDGQYARSLWSAIREANAVGYRVMMHAKRTEPLPAGTISVVTNVRGSQVGTTYLEVRSTLAEDLRLWLEVPPAERGSSFYELAWVKTVYQGYYQHVRRRVLGDRHSLISECTFSTGPRTADPYTHLPEHGSKPAQPDPGSFVDVHAEGRHIGELRLGQRRRSDEDVLKILNGCDRGVARLQRWASEIELRVCIADSSGRLPESTEPFRWQSERRQAESLRIRAKMDAEEMDGKPYYTFKNEFKHLKKSGDLQAARELGLKMVAAAENVAVLEGQSPERWYTMETAIVLRKLKDTKGEIELLRRYLAHCPSGQEDDKITERLEKLL